MEQRAGGLTEDWLSVWIGLAVFVLAFGVLAGFDVLGWVVTTAVWTDASKALAPLSKSYARIGGIGALVATYVALVVVLGAGAAALGANVKRFALGFTAVFWISYLCWIAGSWANFAVTTPTEMQKFGIGWSLKLTNEGGFIIALLVGLAIGNFLPSFAAWMKEAVRPEWYIKTAIVILGGFLGLIAAEKLSLATSLMFRGLAAIIEAYLIYWAVVYFVARKWFGFSREWAAARAFLAHEPMVAGAWMGLAVKTDGAAVASGGITEALILSAAAAEGVNYAKGWILGTTTTVKIFIDIFIGIWAFILAWIWTTRIEVREGDRARIGEIWLRFPKFILGYLVTFAIILVLGVGAEPQFFAKLRAAMSEANSFRGIFFVMTFFTIGVMTDFRRLWEEGIGRLAAVYLLCLFGFVIWVGLAISFLFFAGVKPPLAS